MRENILILAHNDTAPFVDVCNQYAQVFPNDRYAVTIVYLSGTPNPSTAAQTVSENVIFMGLKKRQLRQLKLIALWKLYRLCRAKQFRMVICHRYKPAYLSLLVTKFCQPATLILVFHEFKTLRSRGRRLLLRLLLPKRGVIAGVSNAIREDLRASLAWLPKQQIITLYNAIDPIKMSEALLSRENARAYLQLAEDEFVFGTLGRLVKNKDHANLIQAFAALGPQANKLKLIIMGSGELEQALRAQVTRLKLTDQVLFTGFVPQGFRYLTALDGFVLSSSQEAFGRVLLEAMLAKLPVIATRVHGIPEVMGEIGRLVPAKDPSALSIAMQEVYATPPRERKILTELGFQRVLQHFSSAAFKQQFWNACHS